MPALIAKRISILISILVLSLFVATCGAGGVLAGAGLVTTVGGATFIQGAKHFWVSSSTPTFSGVTTAGGNVDITIGTQKSGVIANSSGNWSFTPPTALSGDNTVTVATSTTSVTFTLTIGSVPANIASSSASSLAPAGSISPTILFLAGGSCLILLGSLGLRKSFKQA